MTRTKGKAVSRNCARYNSRLQQVLQFSFFVIGSISPTINSLPLSSVESHVTLEEVRGRLPKSASDAVQKVACYYQQKEDTERVAFPFLVGLLYGGPVFGLLGACSAAKVSQLCENPIVIQNTKAIDGSYYSYFRNYWYGSTSQEIAEENQSYYDYFISIFWRQQTHDLKYTENDIFGGLLGGLLIGYYMRQSVITALVSAAVASFLATTSDYEGKLVRFVGSSVTSLIEVCRLISHRAFALGWNEVMAEALTYLWNITEPYVKMLQNTIS